MAKELVLVLFRIEVDPVRVLIVVFLLDCDIWPSTLVPVLGLLRTVIGISLRDSTARLLLESFHVHALEQLSLQAEGDLGCLIENIVNAHVILIKKVKVNSFFFDEGSKHLVLGVLDPEVIYLPEWLLLGCI